MFFGNKRMGPSSSSWIGVPPLEAVKTPPAEGLPTNALADEKTKALKLAQPFLADSLIKLINIGEREAGYISSAIRVDVRRRGYGGKEEGLERLG
ncbi:hypothetical protein BDQ17DRAFT_1357312 [Cyathus striatus]|nr:hypothetical protein BDQ17DRAFT_1357312 [Cyathus striatus]